MTINSKQTIVNGVAVTKAIIGFVVQSNKNNKKSTVNVRNQLSEGGGRGGLKYMTINTWQSAKFVRSFPVALTSCDIED